MDEKERLEQLEELTRDLGIEVRYETFKGEGSFSTGGLCKVHGKHLIIINTRAGTGDRIKALAGAVTRFDLSQVYLRPGLREFLEQLPPREILPQGPPGDGVLC
ncbi:MAG: hypothetical protein JXL84_06405 [Deltaproteobacteria bacterium]|nr:hypothetical protein [Deltaproteobacteria bacterium]